jgi:hypothetical protein
MPVNALYPRFAEPHLTEALADSPIDRAQQISLIQSRTIIHRAAV